MIAGDARFEVLGDGLIRMEYSPAGNFENLPTVNVLNRHFPVPQLSERWSATDGSPSPPPRRFSGTGWDPGPFGPSNVQ